MASDQLLLWMILAREPGSVLVLIVADARLLRGPLLPCVATDCPTRLDGVTAHSRSGTWVPGFARTTSWRAVFDSGIAEFFRSAATVVAAFALPSLDRFWGEPDCDVTAIDQRLIVGAPVAYSAERFG